MIIFESGQEVDYILNYRFVIGRVNPAVSNLSP
jgi:hypothetical protein